MNTRNTVPVELIFQEIDLLSRLALSSRRSAERYKDAPEISGSLLQTADVYAFAAGSLAARIGVAELVP